MDAQLHWALNHGDIALDGDDLATDAGLNTAVILSLFTDARATDEDLSFLRRQESSQNSAGAAGTTDPRGWWGDSFAANDGDQLGSKLWLLQREKQLPAVLQRAKGCAEDALAWLLEDGIASAVTVTAEFIALGTLGLAVEIHRPNGGAVFNRQYQYVWSAYA